MNRFDQFYVKEDPWHYNNTPKDCYRRSIFLEQVGLVFAAGQKINNVMDAGCGEGFVTKDLADHFPVNNIDAFDISINAIEHAKNRNSSKCIHYFQSDITHLKMKNKKYDLIICEEVMIYFSKNEIGYILRNFHHLLNEHSFLKLTFQIKGNDHSPNYISYEDIQDVIISNGFMIISVLPYWVNRKKIYDKIYLRFMSGMYKITHLNYVIDSMKNRILTYDIEDCNKISVLARKT